MGDEYEGSGPPPSLTVELARKAIDHYVKTGERIEPKEIPEEFKAKRGVFVTINMYPDGALRGCIGFPEPIQPLYKAIIDAAIAAAGDPRFEELEESELHKITVEVSILTPPEQLPPEKVEEFPKMVDIGKDGLIVRKDSASGLLLPQVAVEHKMEELEFLEAVSEKAGLPKEAWAQGADVFKFQADIWYEEEPHGKISYKELKKS